MAEYIEREAVTAMLKRECSPRVMAYLVDELYKIPAADVRPVVMCRDCKWWRGEGTICKGIGIDFGADGFCCEGERKDGAGMMEES